MKIEWERVMRDKRRQIWLKGFCFNVEVSENEKEKEQGLMFRKYLAPDDGMLFIESSEDLHSFWMKNTSISLDIIWINKKKKVVSISKNSLPYSEEYIYPEKEASYILELNAGMADKICLSIGDEVVI